MFSKLGFLFLIRKIQRLLFVLALSGVTIHIMNRQDILINYFNMDLHTEMFAYASTVETIQSNLVFTDVRIGKCLRGFTCRGPTSGHAGTWWWKAPSKLNLFQEGFSFFNYYLYAEKKKVSESPRFVVDIMFSVSDTLPTNGLPGSKWDKQKIFSKGYMWLNFIENVEFDAPIIRDLNILYGNQDLTDYRPHWKLDSTAVPLPVRQTMRCMISVLRISINQEMSVLHAEQEFDLVLKKNGMFVTSDSVVKILQVSDLHIGQDAGVCYDKCKLDEITINFLRDSIAQEDGDKLVVITGDMIDFNRALHFESVILRALAPILQAQVPFVFVFGNSDHDLNRSFSKLYVLNFIASLPGCYNQNLEDLDTRLHGVTNGNIKIFQIPELSNQQMPEYEALDLSNPKALVTYLDSEENKIDESQANFLYRLNHDLNKDVQEKLLFFHHPLPNFRPTGKVKLIGTYNEKHYLITDTDEKILLDIKRTGYKSVGVGHEHENDACIWDENDGSSIILCYSGATGESAYTRLDADYKRRMRVFALSLDSPKILSWKRDKDGQFDPQEIWSGS